MTLGCGSWGGNVTSDNVSPLHLMDIKRVAFETRAVKSARPALAAQSQSAPAGASPAAASSNVQPVAAQTTGRAIGREEIAAIVDRFLANRTEGQPAQQEHAPLHASASPAQYQPVIDIEAGSRYDRSEAAPQAAAAPTAEANGGNGATASTQPSPAQTASPASSAPPATRPAQSGGAASQATNGNQRKAVDFVSEDDVRRAIQKGEKIYVNARTIITPSARDMGDPAEVFAKV
jgi:histone deacetylase complex regulatory component SIN3